VKIDDLRALVDGLRGVGSTKWLKTFPKEQVEVIKNQLVGFSSDIEATRDRYHDSVYVYVATRSLVRLMRRNIEPPKSLVTQVLKYSSSS
jgi:outer membrane receptor for monomeric catechols